MLNLEIFSQIKQSHENLKVIEDTISLSFENHELEQHINIIKNEIPPKVLNKNTVFWKCSKCGKLYWKGKMWDNMQRVIKKLNQRI